MNNEANLLRVQSGVIGSRLVRVTRLIVSGHWNTDMNVDDVDGGVVLQFSGNRRIGIETSGAGEDAILLCYGPREYDLTVFEEVESSTSEVWKDCIGKKLTGISPVTRGDIETGLALGFEGGISRYIQNFGDDLMCRTHLDSHYGEIVNSPENRRKV